MPRSSFNTLVEARDTFEKLSDSKAFGYNERASLKRAAKAMAEAESRIAALEVVVSALAKKAGITAGEVDVKASSRVSYGDHVKHLLQK